MLGGALRLSGFGAGSTAAQRGSPKPARLTFHVAFLQSARRAEPEFEAFATLSGEVLLKAGAPVFVVPAGAAIEYTSPEPGADEPPPRQLRLEFTAPSFEARQATDAVRSLRLPPGPPDARYVEVALALEIDGAEEAALEQNDRLDVPLAPLSFFEARLTDENEKPLARRPFELSLADGSTVSGTSDEDGLVRVNPVLKGSCRLRLLETEV